MLICLSHRARTAGPTQPGDIDSDIRILTYKALEDEVQNPDLVWAYLPYSMKMAGPREVLQHMIIRKNFGATHFIIGRDMAGTKSTITGEDYYGPYEAHELAAQFEDELGARLHSHAQATCRRKPPASTPFRPPACLSALHCLIVRPCHCLVHTALKLVKFENVVFTDAEGYMGESEAKEKGLKPKKLSGTEFRRLMRVSTHSIQWP